MSADYSQIELRIMAHISGDPGLRAAFAAGEDIHRATAAEVFGLPLAEVGPEQRRYAKTINFGLIYGMGAFGLAQALGIEHQGGARLHRALLRALCRRAPLHGRDQGQRRRTRLRGDAVRPPHRAARDPRRQRARAAAPPSARPSTRRCRARRPT
jgi:hypothetical protein